MIFGLRQTFYEKGDVLLAPGDEIHNLIFVTKGCLEVITEVDGNEFVLEFVSKGGILFSRSILMDDEQNFSVRAREPTFCYQLHK